MGKLRCRQIVHILLVICVSCILQASTSPGTIDLRRSLAFFIGSKVALSFRTPHQRCLLDAVADSDVIVDRSGEQQDDVSLILSLIGVNSTTLAVDGSLQTHKKFRRALREPCQAVFINSGSPLASDRTTVRRLRRFVAKGGVLTTTDLAIRLAESIDFVQPSWKLAGRPAPHPPSNENMEIQSNNDSSETVCKQGASFTLHVMRYLDGFLRTMRSSPRWSLGQSSRLARFKATRNATSCLVFSDLPPRRSSLLTCADISHGQYYHVAGPLAQEMHSDSHGTRLTESSFDLFAQRSILALQEREARELRRLLPFAQDLTVEDISTAAISCSIVISAILQSQTNQKCQEFSSTPRCAAHAGDSNAGAFHAQGETSPPDEGTATTSEPSQEGATNVAQSETAAEDESSSMIAPVQTLPASPVMSISHTESVTTEERGQ